MSPPANFLAATETISHAAAGKLNIVQLAKDHIARFDERDSAVRAWAYFDRDKILRDAEVLDALSKGKRGPLFGSVIGVKDIMNTHDMPTQHGSEAYAGHQPGEDASLVHILRQAGALLIGKTITTEFASTFDSIPTRNPYDATRTPGGSSSGSGAAVREYQCQIALGTQTIGSVIRPASYNGVYGMKPTWNSVPKDGIKMTSVLLDTPGFFARSLSDIELVLRVLNVRDDIPPPSTPKPLSECRFAYCKTAAWTEDFPDLERIWSASRELLGKAGATIDDLDLGQEFEDATSILPALLKASDHGLNFRNEYLDPDHRRHLDSSLVDHVENKSGITKTQLLHAMDTLASLRPKFDALASKYDAVITPSVPGEAPQGTKTGDPRFNAMWTALHVPCVHIPGFASDNGLPIGLTLIAPRYHDERLLSVGKAVAEVWIDAETSLLRPIPTPAGIKTLEV